MARRSLEACVAERRCALCETPDQHDDSFCYGCGSYVCEGCSINADLMGQHDVIEHSFEDEVA